MSGAQPGGWEEREGLAGALPAASTKAFPEERLGERLGVGARPPPTHPPCLTCQDFSMQLSKPGSVGLLHPQRVAREVSHAHTLLHLLDPIQPLQQRHALLQGWGGVEGRRVGRVGG